MSLLAGEMRTDSKALEAHQLYGLSIFLCHQKWAPGGMVVSKEKHLFVL